MALVSYLGKARKLVSTHYPEAMTAVQPKANWAGPGTLPGGLADMYANFGPVDLRLSYWPTDLTMPSLRKLWSLQAGYVYDPSTGEKFKNWDENLTVIGRAGDDCVYVFDIRDEKVYQVRYKRMRWKATLVFESIGEYCMVVVALSVVCKALGDELTDSDGKMTEEAGDKALLELFELMGRDIDRAEAMLVRLGWIQPDED